MTLVKFTDPFLRSLRAEARQTDPFDALTPGLGIRVGKRSKTFIMRRVIGGKRQRITIGPYGPVSLAQARERARTLAAEKQLGLAEPLKAALKYEECLEEFLAAKRKAKKASIADETECLLRRHFAFAADVRGIDDRAIRKALDAIKAPSEARHAYTAVRILFN